MKGKLTCFHCMDDTKAFTLRYGGKTFRFDCHCRFLPKDHPFRSSRQRFLKNKVELNDPSYLLNGDPV